MLPQGQNEQRQGEFILFLSWPIDVTVLRNLHNNIPVLMHFYERNRLAGMGDGLSLAEVQEIVGRLGGNAILRVWRNKGETQARMMHAALSQCN